MGGEYTRKKKRAAAEVSDENERGQLTERAAPAAGESRKTVDPVYSLTSRFSRTFDEDGRLRNSERRENGGKNAKPDEGAEKRHHASEQEFSESANEAKLREHPRTEERALRKAYDSPVYRHSQASPAKGGSCDRFSQYAFRKGILAA